MMPIDLSPEFDVPSLVLPNIDNAKVGDKVEAMAKYEIVEKREDGVTVKLNHLSIDNDRRIY